MDGVEELKALLAAPTEVSVGGRTLALKPFTFEQMYRVAELGAPVMRVFAEGDFGDPLALLKDHAATLVGLCALLAGVEREFVAGLPAGQMLKLLGACIEVNSDFFTDGLPLITKLVMGARLGKARSAPTKFSSPPPSPSPSPEAAPIPSAPGAGSPTS